MIIPVKCFTCGNLISSKYLEYLKRVTEIKEERGIKNENIQYLTENHIEKSIEGQVLDDLRLKKPCCRRHMLTHVDVF